MAGAGDAGRRVERPRPEKGPIAATRPSCADVLRPVADVMAVAPEGRATGARDTIGVGPPVGGPARGAVQVVRVTVLAAVAVTPVVV